MSCNRGLRATTSDGSLETSASNVDVLRALGQIDAVQFHQLDRSLLFACRDRVVDRLPHQVVLGEPPRGGRVQPHDAFRLVSLEPPQQELGEKVVVAEPLTFVIESTQKEVVALRLLQQRLPVTDVSQRGRKITADPLGDGRRHQKIQHLRFERIKHVFGQILVDCVMAPRHSIDHAWRGQRSHAGTAMRAAVPRPSRRWSARGGPHPSSSNASPPTSTRNARDSDRSKRKAAPSISINSSQNPHPAHR